MYALLTCESRRRAGARAARAPCTEARADSPCVLARPDRRRAPQPARRCPDERRAARRSARSRQRDGPALTLGPSSLHQPSQRLELLRRGRLGHPQLVCYLQFPPRLLAYLFHVNPLVNLRQHQLPTPGIGLEHAEIGDHGDWAGTREAEPLTGPRAVTVTNRRAEIKALNERPAAVRRDHDHLAAACGDFRGAAGPGQADPGVLVLADDRRVEVRVAIDLRGAEERDRDPPGADPVVEH